MRHWIQWLLPLTCLLILAGYFGPWVDHKAAALVITGLDLGEYVKFLPVFRNRQVVVWREGFYWPLVAVSLVLSLNAFRSDRGYPWVVRILLLISAIVAALNLLPPAWSPPRLREPEFRLQALGIVVCGLAAVLSPFLALIPRRMIQLITVLLVTAALYWPIRDFLRVLPAIAEVYNQPQQPGWGFYTLIVGLVGLAALTIIDGFQKDAWVADKNQL